MTPSLYPRSRQKNTCRSRSSGNVPWRSIPSGVPSATRTKTCCSQPPAGRKNYQGAAGGWLQVAGTKGKTSNFGFRISDFEFRRKRNQLEDGGPSEGSRR